MRHTKCIAATWHFYNISIELTCKRLTRQIIFSSSLQICWFGVLIFGCAALDEEVQRKRDQTDEKEWYEFSVNGYVCAVGFATLLAEIAIALLYAKKKLNFDLKCLVSTVRH